jgi:hypothetical protein
MTRITGGTSLTDRCLIRVVRAIRGFFCSLERITDKWIGFFGEIASKNIAANAIS